jgi:signal peptide peptidase SppA
MRYEHVLSAFVSTPWALRPEVMHEYVSLLAFRASGQRLSDEAIDARIRAGQELAAARGNGTRAGTVAVMPIIGTFLSRGGAMRDVSAVNSTQQMEAAFKALVADDTVGAIVLDVESPGGEVSGVAEFADTVFAARARKPVVAISNSSMCSAAYWVGSAASELIVAPSSETGSIGVYAAHEDMSKLLDMAGVKITLIAYGDHKVEGNPFEVLSDEARAFFQKRVDEYGVMFVKAVARGRGVSQATVRDSFGGGRVFGAQEAVTLGMADAIGTIDDAISMAARKAKSSAMRAENEDPMPVASAEAEEPVPVASGLDLEVLRARHRLAELA